MPRPTKAAIIMTMLVRSKLGAKLRKLLTQSGVTGEIASHDAKKNIGSVKLLIKQDTYATFGILAVHDAIRHKTLTMHSATEILAIALGVSVERLHQKGPGYIDPELTADGLRRMIMAIDEAIATGQLILVATAHPGSMLAYYQYLVGYIEGKGGRIYQSSEPFQVAKYRWIDEVGGVHMLSDEGNLMHTHDAESFGRFLADLPEAPGLVLADHGYAGAAINRGLKTVAVHDTDDPGIVMAAHLGLNVIAIPMNDNQRNVPTLRVIEAVMADYNENDQS